MQRILERMQSDLLDALGLAITVYDKRHDEQSVGAGSAGRRR